jgi:serine/threonine protein kinase
MFMDKLTDKYLNAAYTIVQVLKESKKSRVVLAVDNISQQPCIIKYIYNTSEIYQDLKQLKHVLLPQIFHVIQTENSVIVVEEYILGKTLEQYLEEQGQLPDDVIKNILLQLCAGLEILHNNQFIHRDIKLSNIMITGDNVVKLIDFDAARVVKKAEQFDTEYLGTRGYAPPEQYGFSQTDIRSDIYALGITLKNLQPKSLRLKNIADKATRFAPDQRYQTVKQILRDLQKRSRLYWFIIFLVIMVLAGVIGGFYFQKKFFTAERLEEKTVDVVTLKQQEKQTIDAKNIIDVKQPEEKEDQASVPAKENLHAGNAEAVNLQQESNTQTQEKRRQEDSAYIIDKRERGLLKMRGRNGENINHLYDRKDREIDTVCLSVHTSYDIDGLGNVDAVKAFRVGDKRRVRGILHMNIVNTNKFLLGGMIYILIDNIVLEKDAITFNKDVYLKEFRGTSYSQTSAILDIQRGLVENESYDIWIDLSKGFLADDYYRKKIDILPVHISVAGIGKGVINKVLRVEEL